MREWRDGAGLLMVGVDSLAAAERAAELGADILDLGVRHGDAMPAVVGATRQRFPQLGIAARVDSAASATAALDAGADLLDLSDGADPALLRLALDRRATLVCPPAAAVRAVALGLAQDRVAVATPDVRAPHGGLAELRRLVETGTPVLVTLDEPTPAGEPAHAAPPTRHAGLIATAAVCAWIGVRILRVASPGEAGELRQTLDMVASIRGDRPPALARRALG